MIYKYMHLFIYHKMTIHTFKNGIVPCENIVQNHFFILYVKKSIEHNVHKIIIILQLYNIEIKIMFQTCFIKILHKLTIKIILNLSKS